MAVAVAVAVVVVVAVAVAVVVVVIGDGRECGVCVLCSALSASLSCSPSYDEE